MDFQELLKIYPPGAEITRTVTLNNRQEPALEPIFLDNPGSTDEETGDYIPARGGWMLICAIPPGDIKLRQDEVWKAKIFRIEKIPNAPLTRDGKTKVLAKVELTKRIEEISEWEYFGSEEKGMLARTVRSGRAILRTEELPATRERAEYRTEGFVIKATEINAEGVRLFKDIVVVEQEIFLDALSRKYGSVASPSALRRRFANVPPAPSALLDHERVKNYIANTKTLNLPVNLKPWFPNNLF